MSYLICVFHSSYEFVMSFQNNGQTVKGYSGDLKCFFRGETEQSRKLRAKPTCRNQLKARMELSLLLSYKKRDTHLL